jgi:hypothetical protein
MNPHAPVGNERGVALVMALLVLLVLSMLSAALMMSVNTETKIAGYSQRETDALNAAEAGLAEAVARIRVGDIPNNLNPSMVAKIFNAPAGSVPVLGANQVALATAQPLGAWLPYSTPTDGPDVLTVRYRTDNPVAPTAIYKYDPTLTPPIQTASGSPIFVIQSTGYAGRDVRRIQEEVILKPFKINVKGALAANVPIKFLGNSHTCGYDHSGLTPNGTDDETPCSGYHSGPEPPLPGGWSTDGITAGGSATNLGQPSGTLPGQAGFYTGPWDALTMTQAEFFQWIGAPVSIEPSPPRGVYYLDNNTIKGDGSGSFSFQGGDGEGMIYVDGDLTVNGNFNYRGIIYVKGDVNIAGDFWCLGSMIVEGQTTIKTAAGSMSILYSSESIQQALQKYNGIVVALSWKEL